MKHKHKWEKVEIDPRRNWCSICGTIRLFGDDLYGSENLEGTSWLHTTEGNIQIYEGTTLTNSKKSWKHKVSLKDKRIKLPHKKRNIELDVIEKNNTTRQANAVAVAAQGSGNLLRTPGNSWLALSNVNVDLSCDTIILSSDFESCRAIPFPNYYIKVKSRTQSIYNVSPQEEIALETLREMISETEFRKYLRDGFLLVQGKSGNIYQIFRKNQHIKVWYNGTLVEEICVSIKDSKIPLTDKIIAFKVIIETDEKEIHNMGNVYNMLKKVA